MKATAAAAGTQRLRPFSNVAAVTVSGPNMLHATTISIGQLVKRRAEVFGRVSGEDLLDLLQQQGASQPLVPLRERDGPHAFAVAHSEHASQARVAGSNTLLLLDVRASAAAYEAGHLRGAIHFPVALLHQDRFPPQLLAFRNRGDCLVVVVDEQERDGVEVATKLREIPWLEHLSVLLLTGGMTGLTERAVVDPRRDRRSGSSGSDGGAAADAFMTGGWRAPPSAPADTPSRMAGLGAAPLPARYQQQYEPQPLAEAALGERGSLTHGAVSMESGGLPPPPLYRYSRTPPSSAGTSAEYVYSGGRGAPVHSAGERSPLELRARAGAARPGFGSASSRFPR